LNYFEILASWHPAVLGAAVFVFGALVGSFLNVVILRFPQQLFHDWRCQCRELLDVPAPAEAEQRPPGLVATRSHCPKCEATIAWYDNIPLISWLILRAKCRACGTAISWRYPLVELITALLSVLVILEFGPTPQGVAALGLTWALIALTGIDFDHQLLPDQITLPLLWLGLVLNLWLGLFASLEDAVIGAVAGYGILWSVFWLFKLLTGKEGMGFGDFKLLGALGAWLGWAALPAIILIASLVGAVVGILLIALARHGREVPIAFGPYLAAAGFLVLLYGDHITDYWFAFLG
jgi:leader peptidase (prepilin peptidase)/N-methyltransferase